MLHNGGIQRLPHLIMLNNVILLKRVFFNYSYLGKTWETLGGKKHTQGDHVS